MKKFTTVLVVACLQSLAWAGCGGDPLTKMEEFASQMCECEDQECSAQVNKAMLEWMKANADKAREPSDADKKRAGEIMERMMKCAGDVGKRGATNSDAAKPDEKSDGADEDPAALDGD